MADLLYCLEFAEELWGFFLTNVLARHGPHFDALAQRSKDLHFHYNCVTCLKV